MSERSGDAAGQQRSTGAGPVTRLRRAVARVDDRMAAFRADDGRRRLALVGAVVAGLALAWLHWLGLIVAGALIGLTRRSLGRALLAGVGFGGLVLAVMAVWPGVVGLAGVSAFAPVSYVTIALAFVLPLWGALVRGVV